MKQNTFTNINLQTIGKQTERIENLIHELKPSRTKTYLDKSPAIIIPHYINEGISLGNKDPIQMNDIDEFTQELSLRLQRLSLENAINTINDSDSSSEVESSHKTVTDTVNKIYSTSKPYYSRPTPVDIQFEYDIPVRDHFDGQSLVEWNLDGFTEYQIHQLLHQILIYATACKTHNNSERGIVHAIVASFSGQLRGWWDHYLTKSARQNILSATKMDASGRSIKTESGEPIPDMIYTLIINIYKHFIGDTHKTFEKNREQLMNLKCSTLTDFKWYKDVFLSQVFQLSDCHNAI